MLVVTGSVPDPAVLCHGSRVWAWGAGDEAQTLREHQQRLIRKLNELADAQDYQGVVELKVEANRATHLHLLRLSRRLADTLASYVGSTCVLYKKEGHADDNTIMCIPLETHTF
jgi:hypothetical protein